MTLPVLKSGDLFPANSTLSAFELKTKLKSRVALWEAAGLGKQPGSLDKNMSICRGINQKAYDWALNHAEASVSELDAFLLHHLFEFGEGYPI